MTRRLFCLLTGILLTIVPCCTAYGTVHQPQTLDSRASWEQTAKLTASDSGTEHLFGWSVDVNGSYALIGAYGNLNYQGTAYIFYNDGTGWTQQAELTASDGAIPDQFGYSVSISGDTAIVGANKAQGKGAAYIFTRQGTTWTQQAKLNATDSLDGDEFGCAVAIDHDTVVIGASYSGNGWSGSAYVFTRTGTTWNYVTKLTAHDAQPEDQLGWSVAIYGDTIVAGAVYDDSRTGAAYVYIRQGSSWTEQAKLTADDAALEDAFGVSVAIEGDTIVSGAGWKDTFIGAAYVFTRTDSTWTQQAKLTPSDGGTGGEFGMAVSLSCHRIIVGARFMDTWTGEAYIYNWTGIFWVEDAKLKASDGEHYDQFGWSVAIDREWAFSGAPGETSPFNGAVYVFFNPLPTPPQKEPLLNVTIEGGLGLNVEVENNGTGNATNVMVTISLSGGLILKGRQTEVPFPLVAVNESQEATIKILGIGPTTITVSATCNENVTATATAHGFVSLFFVLGVK